MVFSLGDHQETIYEGAGGMNKSNIEWCDFTSNPVRGKCLHACPYCYAERIRKRYGWPEEMSFHGDELLNVVKRQKPATIFMGSMYDLWGDWVPKEWLDEVLNNCARAPQHTFLFLTKNPKRYLEFENVMPENCWYGATVTTPEAQMIWGSRSFVSIEPLLSDFGDGGFDDDTAAVIIGAQTGPGAVKPEREWVENIIKAAGSRPIFIKDNLLSLFPDLPRRRELPWRLHA